MVSWVMMVVMVTATVMKVIKTTEIGVAINENEPSSSHLDGDYGDDGETRIILVVVMVGGGRLRVVVVVVVALMGLWV